MDADALANLDPEDVVDESGPTYTVEVSEADLRRAGAALAYIEEAVRGEVSATGAEWAMLPPQVKVKLLTWRPRNIRSHLENGAGIDDLDDEPDEDEEPEDADWGYA